MIHWIFQVNVILSDIPPLAAIARNIENLSLKSEKILDGSNDSSIWFFFPLGPSTLMPLYCIKQKQLEMMFFYCVRDSKRDTDV